MTAQATTRGQQPISRFAPSPTGLLHLGHAYSAIVAHDLARKGGGQFVVRIEDIDGGRSRADYVDAIFDDLRWLGLTWDAVVVQSERQALYNAALARLRNQGLAYRCVCTRAEIAASASAPQGDLPPIYPGTCRGLTIPDDVPTAWRLDMANAADARDLAQAWGDVVIGRKDALASYHLAVVVDDAAQGVTDVVRGRDLLTATDVHRVLQARLGLPEPRYHHHALVTGPNGKRLAKRDGAASLAGMRAGGVDGRGLADDLRMGFVPIGFGFVTT
jgi:glutamyl-Q tRNA(Asp) synthetase